MRPPLRAVLLGVALAATACSRPAATLRTSSLPDGCALGRAPTGSRVLVFSRTTGYRHASIPAAARAIRTLGEEAGFAVEHTEDQTRFIDANLAGFAAVVFLSNTQ